jgi:putative FmdB family regulatory protein
MPLYEYECTACRKHTEKIQKFSDPEITVCPHGYGSAKPAPAAGEASAAKPAAEKSDSAAPAAPAAAATPAPASAPAASSSPSEK